MSSQMWIVTESLIITLPHCHTDLCILISLQTKWERRTFVTLLFSAKKINKKTTQPTKENQKSSSSSFIALHKTSCYNQEANIQ